METSKTNPAEQGVQMPPTAAQPPETVLPAQMFQPVQTGQSPQQGMYQPSAAPVGQLKTHRGLVKYILLCIITLGIYDLVIMSSISNDVNIICSRYDGRKTMHYCLLFFLVGPITLGIGSLVWHHKISSRIGKELRRRGIPYLFGAGSYWLWNILGALIIVGPFVYKYRLFRAMNHLAKHYNQYG